MEDCNLEPEGTIYPFHELVTVVADSTADQNRSLLERGAGLDGLEAGESLLMGSFSLPPLTMAFLVRAILQRQVAQ